MAEKVLRNFHFFEKNLYTRFLGSPITNLRLDLQISKCTKFWEISKMADPRWTKVWEISIFCGKKLVCEVFWVAYYRFANFETADSSEKSHEIQL